MLLHAYGFTMDEWPAVADLLRDRGFDVIAFDQRGHGDSNIGFDGIGPGQMAADLGSVLDAYEVQDAVLVGHSMGSYVGIKFLIDHPQSARERLSGCVFPGAFAGDVGRKSIQNRMQIPLLRTGTLTKAMKRSRTIASLVTRSFTGRPFDPDWVEPFTQMFANQDHERLIPILEAFTKESYYGRLQEIDVPCTIVRGTRDKTTPDFHAEWLQAGIPESSLVLVEDKGHLLNWEAPEIVADEVGAIG